MKSPPCTFVPSRTGYLRERCRGKSVLHLGFGDAIHHRSAGSERRHLHEILRGVGAPGGVYGIDLDKPVIQYFRELWGDQHLILGDAENLSECELDRTFDVVLAGELIEHLNNPGRMLEGIKRFLAPESTLIITTPNALGLKFMLFALAGHDRSHPDHSLFFSFSTLQVLLQRHGFHITRWITSMEVFDQPRNRWARPVLLPILSVRPALAETIIAEATIERVASE